MTPSGSRDNCTPFGPQARRGDTCPEPQVRGTAWRTLALGASAGECGCDMFATESEFTQVLCCSCNCRCGEDQHGQDQTDAQ
jgi:hypothetical protein